MDVDPRDRDADTRDVEMPWVDVRQNGSPEPQDDWRDGHGDARDLAADRAGETRETRLSTVSNFPVDHNANWWWTAIVGTS